MKSFDEWFNKSHAVKTAYSASYIVGSRKGYEAGQQSKQAEVDELIDTIKTSAESEIYLFDELQKVKGERDELRKLIDDLTELNRLKTIALQQSVNRTSIHVHEKIVALERKLKGDQS